MSIILAVLIVVGVAAGRKISTYVKEKRQAKELEAQLEMQREELEQQEQQEEKPGELVIETPPPVDDIIEVPTPEEQLEEYVNMCISEMPLEDKVASLFIVTPEALTGVSTVTQAGDATKEALSNYAVGGLVYFDKNIKSREQLTEMLSTTASSSKYPLFLAVDEEGGSVSRIANSKIDVVKVDEMSVIGTSQDSVAAREAGTTIGTYLKELGFNLDFAPVADVVTDTENSVLGSRSFGMDATVAADMVSNVVEGMQESGVNACLKHFPGLGSAEEDTHEGRVETTRTLEEMRSSDFLPFQAGIEAGANIVMVSHVTASSVDTEGLPSSLSKVVITNVLRGELGFEGVVITDALNMKAISEYYTAEEAAVMAIAAGADMLLMPEDFETAYNGLLAAVQEGTISEERINESLRRIFRIKCADKLE
ncbi:MAG: beta-N-acetylhexosaminidase [Lachnospiraceae bacterium]|nr:beta-N-acetylhexosaminidase [Lachnospiraceae bacterium]